jgi:hypothetical protein
LLNGLLDGSLIFLVFHLFLKLSTLDLFISSHIGIEDLPLGSLEGEISLNGRVSLNTPLLQGEVESLA